jgi:predicted enzyme related to lactoylglutathione lyase
MPAKVGNISFDCEDVPKMAAFWSGVLGRPVDKGGSEA